MATIDEPQENPYSVHMGGHLDQMKAVTQAETLQDFRRQQEGTLMIRDDQPFLIMSFGIRYQGLFL